MERYGYCIACGKRTGYRLPRGWNLRRGLVAVRCSDGDHWVYLNPSGSHEAACKMAAIIKESERYAWLWDKYIPLKAYRGPGIISCR